ncbi:MAG: hypothetical protein WKF40_06345 [Thermoleophilaceae bacterium]
MGARAARVRRGARRRDAADRQPLGLALPRRQGRRARARCSSSARATTSCVVAFCNLVGGQDELVFDGHSLVIDHEGTVLARAPGSSRRTLLVADVDPRAAIGRAPARRAAGARAGAASRRRALAVLELEREARRRRSAVRAGGAPWRRSTAEPRSTPRSCSACATTCDKNGFDRRRARPLGRHRLGADGVRSPSTRSGPSACTAAIMPSPLLHVRDAQDDARAPRRQPRGRLPSSSPSSRPIERLRGDAGGRLRRAASPTSPRRTSRRAPAATC